MWTLKELHDCLKRGKLIWRKHALQRMLERGIKRDEVKRVLRAGEIIETYEKDRPLPSALLCFTDEPPLHVVAGLDSNRLEIHIITVYTPDPEHFEPDSKTRIKRE